MNLLPQGEQLPLIYVATPESMATCVAELAQVPAFAFDLEFDRDHYTYGFDLCLMQIASATHCYLIDPKGDIDIRLIFPLLESRDILKVVHCSGEDLRLLHSMQCFPKNLADTEVYAKLLNYDRPSLGAMIQQLFGVELDKKLQKINWALRPLGPAQQEYAANDVLYLLAMKTELERQATEKNLLPFIAEENELLSTTIHQMGPKENFLKKADLQYLSPYDQYVLNGVFRYRDGLAQQQNKPAHYIMNEDTVRSLAFDDITEGDWPNIKGVHPILKSSAGREKLFDTVEMLYTKADELKLSRKRSYPTVPEDGFQAEKARLEHLKATVFSPIQQAIAAIYGEHAMRFILSTSAITPIIQGQAKIGELKTAYRRQMVRQMADKLGIDLTPFE